MKKYYLVLMLVISITFLNSSYSRSEFNFDPKLKFQNNTDFSKQIKEKDYSSAMKMQKKIANSFFGLSVDFQLGYNSTSPNVTETSNLQPVTTTSDGGFLFAALLNVNLFEVINFTTGLDFTKKNFGVEIPHYDSVSTIDSIAPNLTNSYMNIPLNVSFGGMISEDVGISFSGGPYLGILLNPSTALGGYKDFDFGLNGILTGRYFLNPFMAIILGTSGQYGGLNNLISTSSVESMQTFSWGLFSGLSVGF